MAVTVNKRETWAGKLDFILALIGFSVGLGNIWRFPYLCYKNGGGCFLIPYGICLILAGVPILILEVALGQFTSSGGITAWNIVPLFQGIGYASVVVVQWLNIYYIVILGWALYYMFASFTSVLPWSHCNNDWNTERCIDSKGRGRSVDLANGFGLNSSNMSMAAANATNITRVSASQEYWENRVLQISDSLEEPGTINWEMALCLLLGWIICYLCVWKGVKSTGKVVYFTATFPYVLLIILMVRAVTLDGAIDGIKFYVSPNFTRLQDGQVWLDAGTQVFFSYSIGLGTLIALGSYNKFHNNLYRDCIIFSIVNSGTSFWGGFVIFSILGFMAKKQGVPVATVAASGPGLAFIAYPAAVTEMPVSPLWSILFFFMVILLGLDSEFVGVEGFVTAIVDLYPQYLRKGYRKEIFIGCMSIFWFLIGLSMVTNGGMYVFQLFDAYSASGSCLLWIAVFQSIGIGWFYGGNRFYDDMADMIGFRINPWLKICWTFFSPLFCMAIFIFSLVTYEPLNYNNRYLYPPWAQAVGWIMALSSIVCIPLVAIIKLCWTDGTLRERWVKLTSPNPPQRDPEEGENGLHSIGHSTKKEPAPGIVLTNFNTSL